MLAQELIVENIPALSTSDTAETALGWMDDFKVSHLTVIENGVFLGTISESDVLGLTDTMEPIGSYKDQYNKTFVTEGQHIFEVVRVVNEQRLTLIPVLDSREAYLGCTTITRIMKIIANMPVSSNPGGIIVIELNQRDYSLHQIAGIIEEHNAVILGSFITSNSDSTKIELTIKVNKTDIGNVIASLQRHDYMVTFYGHDNFGDDLRDRFDSLMNYLNI